MCSGSNQGRLF